MGHISATSSVAGLLSSQMMGAYNVAKHGVVALMQSVERELRAKKSHVRASVLCPGPINTNISRHSVSYRPGVENLSVIPKKPVIRKKHPSVP